MNKYLLYFSFAVVFVTFPTKVFSMGVLDIVDNNVNKNIVVELHGYCTGPDFRYDVYWDDSSEVVADVEVVSGGVVQQTIDFEGFFVGNSASSSPATYIVRNNSSTDPFDIYARDAADASTISDAVTVKPKDCVSQEVGSDQDFVSSNGLAYTVPSSGVTHVRVSAIGGGGNGSKKPGNNKVTSGGGGGAAAIRVSEVSPADELAVTVGAGRSGGAGSIGRGGTSDITLIGTGILVSAQGGGGRGQGYEGFNAGGSTGVAHVLRSGGGTSNATGAAAGNLVAVGYAGALVGGGTTGSGGSTGKIAGGGGSGLRSGQIWRNAGTGARGEARIETYDTEVVLPDVTIEQAASQVDPHSANRNALFTATFSEAINASSFTCQDVVVDGTSVPDCTAVVEIAPNDGTVFEVTTTSATNGTVTVSVPAAAVHDILGNNNTDSTSVDNIVTLNVVDDDGDGVPSTVEDNGANGGDGNGDGVLDSAQQSVAGAFNSVTGDYTTLEASGSCTFITQNAFVAESALAVQDPTYEYPFGLVDFQISCATPGDSSDVAVYYTQDYDTSDWLWRKFDGQGNVYADIASLVTFSSHTYTDGPRTGDTVTKASFSVTDGDPKTDEDKVVDGFINDPSGPSMVDLVSDEEEISEEGEEEVEADEAEEAEEESTVETCTDGSIGNRIWLDANSNGKEDEGESGIEGISIKLKDKNGKTLEKDKTNSYGKYDFKDLPKGDYRVVVDEDDLVDYIQTYDPRGSVMNNVARTSLGCDEDENGIDFGYKQSLQERPRVLAKTGGEHWWERVWDKLFK